MLTWNFVSALPSTSASAGRAVAARLVEIVSASGPRR
jgi:hypothetical protein